MPSLHAAYPVLSALHLRQAFGRWGLLMLGSAAVLWFAVVYMAEHWIIDVAAGVVLTAALLLGAPGPAPARAPAGG